MHVHTPPPYNRQLLTYASFCLFASLNLINSSNFAAVLTSSKAAAKFSSEVSQSDSDVDS
jgi:hypothetical protein